MASVIDAKTTSNKDSEVEVAANGHGENGSPDTSVAVAENGSAHSAAADKAGKDGEKKEDSSPEISTSKLLSFATPCETAFIYIATFFSYVSSLSTPFVAYLFGSIISRFGNSENPGAELVDLGPDTTFLLLAGLGAFVIGFVGEFLWKYTSANQSMRMREAFVDAVFKQEIAFFESGDTEAGALSARLGADVQNVEKGLGKEMVAMGSAIVGLLAGVTFAFSLDWRMASAVLCCIPLIATVGSVFGYMMGKLYKTGAEFYGKASAIAEESLNGIRTVAAFGGEDKSFASWKERLTKLGEEMLSVGFYFGATAGLFGAFMYGNYAIVMYAGSLFILNDNEAALALFPANETLVRAGVNDPLAGCKNPATNCMDGGKAMTIFFCMLMSSFGLMAIGPALETMKKAKGSGHVIFELIERIPKMKAPSKDIKEPIKNVNLKGAVSLKDVSFAYPSRKENPVFTNFNLDIPAGKSCALVGTSGCGKSTIINLIERFYDPDSGVVAIDGEDIANYELKWLRSKMAIVEQEPKLFNTTVHENIAQGRPGATRKEVVEAAKKANAHDFIKNFPEGYDTVCGAHGNRISGGQAQRIAIARCLLRDPAILLLDEATSALDIESERTVQKAIDKMIASKSGQMTTIVIAHRLSTVRNVDTIFVMDKGAVVEKGSHEELLKIENGVYAKLHKMQSRSKSKEDVSDDFSTRTRSNSTDDRVRSTSLPENQLAMKVEKDTKQSKSMLGVISDLPFVKGLLQTLGCTSEEAEEENEAAERAFARVMEILEPDAVLRYTLIWCSMASGALMMVFPVIFSMMLSIFFLKDREEMMTRALHVSIALVVLALLSFTFRFLSVRATFKLSDKLIFTLRNKLYKSMIRQNIGFHDQDKNGPGNLLSMLSKEMELIRPLAGQGVAQMIEGLTGLFVGIIIAFYADWRLSLLAMAFVPLAIFSSFARHKKFMALGKKNLETLDGTANVFLESVRLIRTVTAFNLENERVESYDKAYQPIHEEKISSAWTEGLVNGLSNASTFPMYASIFAYASYLAQHGLTLDRMIMAMFALLTGASGVGRVGDFMSNTGVGKAAAARIYELIDREPPISLDAEGVAVIDGQGDDFDVEGTPAIEFDNVVFSYPTRKNIRTLDGLSFTARRGQVIALVGESGCGKSTVMALLKRYYDPGDGAEGSAKSRGDIVLEVLQDLAGESKEENGQGTEGKEEKEQETEEEEEKDPSGQGFGSGTVRVFGQDVRTLDLKAHRARIGEVGQMPILFSDTIAGNIRYGNPAATDDEIKDAATQANALGFIEELPDGFETKVGGSTSSGLSGGQKQRVCIARCLVRKPAIMLLDEATSALDNESEKLVQDSIDKLLQGAKDRYTVVMIAHKLSTVRNADKIIVLEKGKVKETGTHAQLLQKGGIYARMLRLQGGVEEETE